MKSPVDYSRVFSAALLFLALGACAETQWYKTGGTDAQKSDDLRHCESFARAQIETERRENPPSPSGNVAIEGGSQSELSTSLTVNLENHGNRQSFDRLVNQCMADNGYIKK